MSGLTEIDVERLRKITGVFDSPIDAEASAAFSRARAVAVRCGIPLVDALVAALIRPTMPASMERAWTPEPMQPSSSWMRKVTLCRDAPHLFNADAREFLRNLSGQRREPTANQMKWLDDLHNRACRHFEMGRAA